jgi:hypothetical protein
MNVVVVVVVVVNLDFRLLYLIVREETHTTLDVERFQVWLRKHTWPDFATM